MSDPASHLSDSELADLCALADGTLPAERRPAVEARVAASPELQELLERQRLSLASTGALADESVPASLRARVEDSRSRDRPRFDRRWLLPRAATASVFAVLLAVVATVMLTGGPGGPTVAEAARFAADAPAGGPAPRPLGDDGARLAVDVDGVVFPDLMRSFGWQALAVHRDRVDGRDATAVIYGKDGRRITYAIVAGRGLPPPSAAEGTTRQGVRFDSLRVDGQPVVTWRRLGHTCVLVGQAPSSELLALASWRGYGTLRY